MDTPTPKMKVVFSPPEHPYPQQFSFMYPIIKYIYTIPSSGKAWKNLIKTCKYFYSKNPLFPVKILEPSGETKWIANGEVFDSSTNNSSNWKFWLYDEYGISRNLVDFDTITSLMPKIYKISLQKLWFVNQNLTWDDYEFLTSSGSIKYLSLIRTTVKYSDETIVTVDKLLQNFSDLMTFDIACSKNVHLFEENTVNKMVEYFSYFKNLRSLLFRELPESFRFSDFTNFLMNNKTIRIQIYFGFNLSEAYKQTLDNFIDNVLANPPTRIPYIEFSEFIEENYAQYKKLYNNQK